MPTSLPADVLWRPAVLRQMRKCANIYARGIDCSGAMRACCCVQVRPKRRDPITRVLLVGGATRMPAFRRFVRNMTGLDAGGTAAVDPDEVRMPRNVNPRAPWPCPPACAKRMAPSYCSEGASAGHTLERGVSLPQRRSSLWRKDACSCGAPLKQPACRPRLMQTTLRFELLLPA